MHQLCTCRNGVWPLPAMGRSVRPLFMLMSIAPHLLSGSCLANDYHTRFAILQA